MCVYVRLFPPPPPAFFPIPLHPAFFFVILSFLGFTVAFVLFSQTSSFHFALVFLASRYMHDTLLH